MAIDFKKQEKELYQPETEPSVVDVPEMTFIRVDGEGDPNDPEGEYATAVELLYALSYAIKMMPRSGEAPEGYFEYVVPPLDGYWWVDDEQDSDFRDKSKYRWTAMLRQPEFVTPELFENARAIVAKKKPGLDLSKARLVSFREGLCVQCMHVGPFSTEAETIRKMMAFTASNGLAEDFSDVRRHHEIYLSDPRKGDPAKMKTILRHPVKRV